MVRDMGKQEILDAYGITASHLFGGGMEAEVYALGETSVLKLYDLSRSSAPTTSASELLTLQRFYDQLEEQLDPLRPSYSLPHIRQVDSRGSDIVVIEDRLSGRPFAELVAECSNNDQLEAYFQTYIAAIDELSQIEMPSAVTQYKLFDAGQISLRMDGDWHCFLLRYLEEKLAETGSYFARDVENYGQKVRCIKSALSGRYDGVYRLVHGDFCLGNLLVDDAGQVTALLDFGLFTMYGDPHFDMATGWVFFDMYDELGANIHDRLLAAILEKFGEALREKLYRYVLLYSFLAANTYSPTCTGGHYKWSVANLNNNEYWSYLL